MSAKKSRRGAAAITLHHVAKVAGVSPMTVSRVIGGVPTVNREMRERVEAAIARTGYAPNAAAQKLASGGITRIGVVYGNPSASFTSEMLIGLVEASSRLGCQLVLKKCKSPSQAAAHAEALVQAQVHGVILPTPLCDNARLAALFAAAEIPTLALGGAIPNGHRLALLIDNVRAAREMTRHLISMGHRDIGFVRGHRAQIDSEQRFLGFEAALREAGLPLREDWVKQGDYSYRSGVEAADELLAGPHRPSAIFASNDEMAAGALAAAHRRGLEVPDQLSIAGFDDTALAKTVWPSLTTIRQPVADMSDRALEMMVEEIRRRSKRVPQPRSVTIKLKLIKRESVSQFHPEAG